MFNELLKEKIIDEVRFAVYSITGKEITIGSYTFIFNFDIENKNELQRIADVLNAFYEHLVDRGAIVGNGYIDTITVEDKEKLDMMNNLLDFIKEHTGE